MTDTLQVQSSGSFDPTVAATVDDVDAFGTSTSTVAALHAAGRHVICYIDAGSYEVYRPDAQAFPPAVIGAKYVGYPDESWLDIRRIDLLAPIMTARLDICQKRGFDAVEPDNIDGWENATGFPLTARDQLDYNTWFAARAHERGLAVALKNDGDQVPELAATFDFAIVEDCWKQNLCALYAPFVAAGKAVFTIEYTDETSNDTFLGSVCTKARVAHVDAILKNRSLDAFRETCPP